MKDVKMKDLNQSGGMPELTQAWTTLQGLALLRPIRNEADFVRLHALADSLSDEIGDDEDHPLFSLFEITTDLIERWEESHIIIPDVEPKEVLRFLLEENELRQKDLGEIASPALISDILAGRRGISKTLAKNLAKRFHVNVNAFM